MRLPLAELFGLVVSKGKQRPDSFWVCVKDKREKKDRKRRRGAAAVDEGWEEVSPEDMSAAAELLAEEMQVIKAAMQVQASALVPLQHHNLFSCPRNGPLMCINRPNPTAFGTSVWSSSGHE